MCGILGYYADYPRNTTKYLLGSPCYCLQFCCKQLPVAIKVPFAVKYLSRYTNSRFHPELRHCCFQLTSLHSRQGISAATIDFATKIFHEQFRVTQLMK
jgi:hypothetical protein